jgi:predicted kinase
MATQELNFDVLAEDNIRTLHVPKVAFEKPVCVVMVGIPEAGKTFLAKNLSEKFPLAVLSETDMVAFLSPRATIFKRGALEVFQLAIKTIEHLIKGGKACIYDANIKTREQRSLIKTAVEQAGGSFLLVYVSCPKELCYERLQKHNLAVNRGEIKGFILDKDYFEYEVASTRLPAPEEHHLVYNCENPESILLIEAAIERRLNGSN